MGTAALAPGTFGGRLGGKLGGRLGGRLGGGGAWDCSRGGGGGGTGPLAGVGGALFSLWPVKAGGTPNLCPAGFSSCSSMGVFGGLGGGAGPGGARAVSTLAYLPASGSGGGALKRGRGGVGSCGGVGSLCTSPVLFDPRGAGGGGGAPRREVLSAMDRPPPGGGGGGGGARPWL